MPSNGDVHPSPLIRKSPLRNPSLTMIKSTNNRRLGLLKKSRPMIIKKGFSTVRLRKPLYTVFFVFVPNILIDQQQKNETFSPPRPFPTLCVFSKQYQIEVPIRSRDPFKSSYCFQIRFLLILLRGEFRSCSLTVYFQLFLSFSRMLRPPPW